MKKILRQSQFVRPFVFAAVIITVFICCWSRTFAQAGLSQTSISVFAGKRYQLLVNGVSQGKVKWSSKNKEIAKVSSRGNVAAVKKGKTVITATVQGQTYRCTVKVKQPVKKIKLNKKTAELKVGKLLPLIAQVKPKSANNQKIKWKSSNPSVALVSANGIIKGISAGTAVITAQAKDGSGAKATCAVSVTEDVILVESLTLNTTQANVEVGDGIALIRYIAPSTATNTAVEWSSSNDTVATVNSMGFVETKTAGTATITAKALDGSEKTACCIMNVTEPPTGEQPPTGRRAQFLQLLQKYEAQLQADKARGIFWNYSVNYSEIGIKYPNSWPKAMAPGALKGAVCATLPVWALKEMGILADNETFWDTDPSAKNHPDTLYFSPASTKQHMEQSCEFLHVSEFTPQLISSGVLQPGDICTWVGFGHVSVYAGNGMWYDAGHAVNINGHYVKEMEIAGKTIKNVYVFDSWGPVTIPDRNLQKVDYIIRIKD